MSKDVSFAPPYDVKFSAHVSARYGFKDGHVELEVELPFPLSTLKKSFSQSFTLEEFLKLHEAVLKAKMWADLPDYQRERDGV